MEAFPWKLFGLFTVAVANLGAYDVDVSALPAGVDITVVVVLTALVGAIKVPAAIRRGARLRHGVIGARTRLLGMAAVALGSEALLLHRNTRTWVEHRQV